MQKLKRFYKENEGLKKEVARICLEECESYESPKNFFEDLENNGCINGMIADLIYYEDTHKFYHQYCEEINELLDEYAESTGEEFKPDGDRTNAYAWFGFETIAQYIANDLYF